MNPYAPPPEVAVIEASRLGGGLSLQCTLLEKSWMRRTFQIEGSLQCRLRYDAFKLREEIYQDDHVVASQVSFWYCSRFDGGLIGNGRTYPFSLEVRLWAAVVPRAMRLTIDGVTVYSEGDVSIFGEPAG